MLYIRFPLSLRNVEDLLFERGIDICHETVRLCARHVPDMAARLAGGTDLGRCSPVIFAGSG